MPDDDAFTHTEPDLLPILHDLQQREPIFHRPEFGADLAAFDRLMAPDYWEIGASGRRYSRQFILGLFATEPPVDAAAVGWRASSFACRHLGSGKFLLTYTLAQDERRTRRSTIWQRLGSGWQIVFHQGTVLSSREEDVPSAASSTPSARA